MHPPTEQELQDLDSLVLSTFGRVLWVASTDRNLSASQLVEILGFVPDLGYREIVSVPDLPLDLPDMIGPNSPIAEHKSIVFLLGEDGYPTAIIEISPRPDIPRWKTRDSYE